MSVVSSLSVAMLMPSSIPLCVMTQAVSPRMRRFFHFALTPIPIDSRISLLSLARSLLHFANGPAALVYQRKGAPDAHR